MKYGSKYSFGPGSISIRVLLVLLVWVLASPAGARNVSGSGFLVKSGGESGSRSHEGRRSSPAGDPYLVREFSVEGEASLSVSTPNGDIEVNSVKGLSRIRVELYVERGFALWSSNKSMDNYRITTMKRGNSVVASVEPLKRDTGFWGIGEMKFSFVVSVPESLASDLSTMGGKVHLNGVRGKQLIKSTGGDITLSDIRGPVIAQTAGGNIVADGVQGVLKADTKGGDITISSTEGQINARTFGGKLVVNESAGEFRLKASSGNIEAERIKGALVAQTVGGNIAVGLLDIRDGLSLNAISGDVTAEVPEGGYDLLLQGDDIDFRGASDWFKGERSDTRMEGRVKDGGPPINLKAVSGAVTLKFK